MWGIYSSLKAAFKQKRKCQKCGHIQLVDIGHKNKSIKCSKCGENIPVPKTQL